MKVELKIILKSILLTLIVLFFIFSLTFILYIRNINSPNNIIIDKDKIEIKGLYQRTILIKDINELEFLDEKIEIHKKYYGVSILNNYRGIFRTKQSDNVRLYMQDINQSKSISIKTDNNHIIINFKDKKQTIKLYNEIQKYYILYLEYLENLIKIGI